MPGYEQEQFLGHGAYGEVWVAVNRNSNYRASVRYKTTGIDPTSLVVAGRPAPAVGPC